MPLSVAQPNFNLLVNPSTFRQLVRACGFFFPIARYMAPPSPTKCLLLTSYPISLLIPKLSPASQSQASHTLALIQHRTGLYVVNVYALASDLMYQQALRRFGLAARMQVEGGPQVRDLLRLAVRLEELRGELTVSLA